MFGSGGVLVPPILWKRWSKMTWLVMGAWARNTVSSSSMAEDIQSAVEVIFPKLRKSSETIFLLASLEEWSLK